MTVEKPTPMKMTIQWAGPVTTTLIHLRIDGEDYPFEIVGQYQSNEYSDGGHVTEVRAVRRMTKHAVDP
jgi:hypothetical protein